MEAKKRKKKLIAGIYVAAGVLTIIVAWYILSTILKSQGNHVVPYPHDTFVRVCAFLFYESPGNTWANIGWTLLRLLIGFGVSFLLGGLLGTLAGLHPNLKSFLSAGIGLFKVIPTAGVVIILMGIFIGPKNAGWLMYAPSMLTFLVAFPLIYESFAKGIRSESEDVLKALDVDGGRNAPYAVIKVLLPAAKPYVVLALAQSLGLSLKVSVMSEVLTANSSSHPGIGGLISLANQTGTIEDVLAYAAITVMLMVVLDVPLWVLRAKRKQNEN